MNQNEIVSVHEETISPWTDKLVVTGTGRCGTTLIMRLLTAMKEDTGYTSHRHSLHDESHAGMERVGTRDMSPEKIARLPKIIKDPRLSIHLSEMAARGDAPGHVFWCFRPLDQVAESRFASNRPWFPDDRLADLSKVPRRAWPKWATLHNQHKIMAEVAGHLVGALLEHKIQHTVAIFPEDMLDPTRLWRVLCGSQRRGSIAEFLGWRTQEDLDRFNAAYNEIVDPELIHWGKPE